MIKKDRNKQTFFIYFFNFTFIRIITSYVDFVFKDIFIYHCFYIFLVQYLGDIWMYDFRKLSYTQVGIENQMSGSVA